ncbi:MAG: sulfotransferase [Lentisphaeria bacterium]|nr:sulfotransferase [Lentisphaeria bacterium]NQZ69684.1 sulfotransferase [Lentisphaeria bacterium]
MLVTVIGRGHGGTRAMSHTLSDSGVFMGDPLNESGDLLPPRPMYDACRVLGKHVIYKGNYEWDFSKVLDMEPEQEFVDLINQYLQSVMSNQSENRGWKLPETTLAFPWIIKLFPEIKYIQWVRDPRDSILKGHPTDDLGRFNIDYDKTDNIRLSRAISWKYQMEIIKATPKPDNWITVRFEDFVLEQDATLSRLNDYLGMDLAKIEVRPKSVGRWKTDTEEHDFDFFQDELKEHSYK